MKMSLVKAHVSNLKPLQKLEELHGLHLPPELVGYPCSAITLRFRKALCTKFLQKWEVKAVAFSENDWLFWWSEESPSRDEQALPSFPFLTRFWKDLEGRKITLFNNILKVNLLHLQSGKVDHSLLFAHTRSCFHKSDSCWRYSCLAPLTLPWTFY